MLVHSLSRKLSHSIVGATIVPLRLICSLFGSCSFNQSRVSVSATTLKLILSNSSTFSHLSGNTAYTLNDDLPSM